LGAHASWCHARWRNRRGARRTWAVPNQRNELLKTFAHQAVIAIENTRLLEAAQASKHELQQSLEYQTAISNVLAIISRSPSDLKPVLDTIVETAWRLCSAERAHVWMMERNQFRLVAHTKTDPKHVAFLEGNPIPTGRGSIAGRAASEQRTVHVTDALEEDPELSKLPQIRNGNARTVACVPLLRAGQTIGVINLARTEVRPFTHKQIELIETFADQAVIAIENARLFEAERASKRELQESLEYQTATSEVLNVISRSPSQLQPVVDTIVQTAKRLCLAERATMWRWREGKFELLAHTIIDAALAKYLKDNPIPPDRSSLASRAVLEGRTMHVPDLQADPELGRKDQVVIARIRTLLAVPLLRKGEPIGVLSLSKSKVEPFSDTQIELITTFADQAVIAIENTRLFEEVQARTRQVQESLDYQIATSDVLNVISRSPTDIQPVFETIAQSAAHLCEAKFCRVFRFDGKLIHYAASHGVGTQGLEATKNLYPMPPGRGSAAARAILSGAVEQIPDVQADPEYAIGRGPSIIGFRSVAAVPMLKEGRPIGAIAILRSQAGLLPERQITLLRTFADQAVIAIENARLFEEVQARTRS
jgi:GAF domain-containing protein